MFYMKKKKSQGHSIVLFVRIDERLSKAMDWEVRRTKEGWGGRISRAAIVRRILWKYMVDNNFNG